jgi:hypothetical protein
MNSLNSTIVCAFVVLGIATGCTAETDFAPEVSETDDALRAREVKLPAGDPCRDVLAPLALGLADGAHGLAFTSSVTVSLTSETESRFYTVSSTGRGSGAPVRYEVELSNDSASQCLFLSAKRDDAIALENDTRSRATSKELRPTVPVSVSPAGDDCSSTVKLLAQAVGLSAVGASSIQSIRATLVSETEDRDYDVHVDGKSFVANGKTFTNDYDFTFNMSNDSASKCFVQELMFK